MTVAATEGAKPAEGAAAAAAAAPAEGAAAAKPADGAAAAAAAEGSAAAGAAADGAKPAESGDGKPAAQAAAGAPEKYDLKIPQGGRVDESDVKNVEIVARANNWTNEQAQAALNGHAEALAEQSAMFLDELKADTTYGGDKLEKTQQLAAQALDRIRPKDTAEGKAFRALLDKTGYGNKKEIVAFLADLGTLMSEDKPNPNANSGSKEETDPASKLYGS